MDTTKQSGFIPEEPSEDDYFMGGVTGVVSKVQIESGDWTPYQPAPLPQYLDGKFDTLSCTTFSALSVLETKLNFMIANNKLSGASLSFLRANGYMVDNKVHFSRRFTAIKSGTTMMGNTFKNVADSIRREGLVPDYMLPFGGTTWSEYHDTKNIDLKMNAMGLRFLSFFDVKYEWVVINSENGLVDTPLERKSVKEARQETPLQMGIPFPSTHATTLMSDTEIFDTYTPFHFVFSDTYPVHYIFKISIEERKTDVVFRFENNLGLGSVSNDVIMLQKFLNTTDTPIGNYGKETTFFGELTKKALVAFQKKWAISPAIGYFGAVTRAKVNSLVSLDVVVGQSKLDAWCMATQRHEGYYPGSTSYRNNNPGNLRYVGQANTTGRDIRNFAIFSTYADGYQALKMMLVNACTGKSQVYNPTDTLYQFYAKYAPDSDGNNSRQYADTVALAIGVSPTVSISSLI